MINNIGAFLSKSKKTTVTVQAIAATMALLHASPSLSYNLDSSSEYNISSEPTHAHSNLQAEIKEQISEHNALLEHEHAWGMYSPNDGYDLDSDYDDIPRVSYNLDSTLSSALQDRPYMHNFAKGNGKLKVMELNEGLLSNELKGLLDEDVEKLNAVVKIQRIPGVAKLLDVSRFGMDETLCLIAHEQSAPVVGEKFYEIVGAGDSPAANIFPKHMTDFFIKNHEAAHCSAIYATKIDTEFNKYLYTSLKEVAADLGTTIDYMRITGKDDIYTDFIKPLRMSAFGPSTHRTSWALAEIMKDIDPQIMMHQEAKDVPLIVDLLMRKHVLADDGRTIDLEKPAGRLLDSEVRAHMDISSNNLSVNNRNITDKLKSDVVDTISYQHQRYKEHLSTEQYEFHSEGLMNLVLRYNLPYPEEKDIESRKMLDKSMTEESFADYYLGH